MVGNLYGYQNLILENRIVRSATNDYCGHEDGTISEEQIEIYKKLAQSSIGMIITGNFFVMEEGRLDYSQNAINKGFDSEGVGLLCDTVHSYNSKIIFQISHAGRKTKISESLAKHFEQINDLCDEEIDEIIAAFANAAKRTKMCGADGVQIHFGHGYLLSELLAKRKDGLDIASKLLKKVRDAVDDFPILVKVNTDIPNEIKKAFYECCERYAVWAVELSGSDFLNKKKDDHLYYAKEIPNCKANCNIPVILTGGVRNAEDINHALAMGADLIGMSRPFICQPDLMKHLKTEGSKCISCNRCFQIYKERKQHCIMRNE